MLMASLEYVDHDRRCEMANMMINRLLRGGSKGQEPLLWALGRVLSRVPLYSSVDTVISSEAVEALLERLPESHFQAARSSVVINTLIQATRITENRFCDVSETCRLRHLQIAQKLGANDEDVLPMRRYVPVDRQTQAALLGDQLPHGILLAAP